MLILFSDYPFWALHNIKNYLRLYFEWTDPRFSTQYSSYMIFVNKLSNVLDFYHVICKNAFKTEKDISSQYLINWM